MSDCGRLLLVLVCVACVIIIAPTSSLAQLTSRWPPRGATQKRFYIENSYMQNWFGAYVACQKTNSRLARVENEEDNKQILHLIEESGLKNHLYWVGATDLAKEGRWMWLLTDQPVRGFTYWHNGEPNDDHQGEDCLSYGLLHSEPYKWNDESCYLSRYFICEYYNSTYGASDCD